MKTSELITTVSALRQEKQSFLNDTFLWVDLARSAIACLPDDKYEFQVPRGGKPGKMRTVRRNNTEAVKERIINKDIYNSAFISIVAAVEDYFSKIMRCILLTDNNRIKCTISGISFSRDIPIVDLLNFGQEDLIERIIETRIQALFYASPQKQLEYFDKALGIQIDEDQWEQWIEIKARRDLWVHNGGIVNQIYLNKTQNNCSFALGDIASIDSQYFGDSISILKSIIGRTSSRIKSLYCALSEDAPQTTE